MPTNTNYITYTFFKKFSFPKIALLFAILFSGIPIFPLQAQKDLALSNRSQLLDARLGKENLAVFNGIRFYDLLKSDKVNFRYFKNYKPFNATITYNGQVYESILTRYDLLNDHLIVYTLGKSSFFQVQLANEKIDAFQLDALSFIRLDLNDRYDRNKNAFYEVAYVGEDIDLLIAWSKAEKLKTNSGNPFYTFKTSQKYYLKKESKYFNISSIRDVIQLFPEHKKDLKEFYRAYRKIDKKDPRQFMQKLAFFLDQSLNN
ncbi:MAG TPA: hypothetical protein ENH91_12320 [Leeuwenhoekiella sp.]|nr:hypothetical protein [Leeuwenhoekiella sp.]